MEVKQQQKLKAQAHSLKPVVLMGEKGLTENVMLEIDLALASHELIKVKARRLPKEEKQQIAAEIVKATKSELGWQEFNAHTWLFTSPCAENLCA